MNTVCDIPRFEIPLCWKSPELIEGKHFDWHQNTLHHIQPNQISELICGPKVYRWLMRASNKDVEACYIGETVDFYKRLFDYRRSVKTPNGKNKRLVKAMKDCEDSGGTVNLEFLCLGVDGFYLNEVLINDDRSLGNHEARLMMESISIVTFMKQHPNKLINHVRKSAISRGKPKLMELYRKNNWDFAPLNEITE